MTAQRSEDHGDLSGDGVPDVILTQDCGGENVASPDAVRVFDGRSSARQPTPLGTLLGPSDGLDQRGLWVLSTTVVDDRLIVTSRAYQSGDPDGQPSVLTTDVFEWDGTGLKRLQERSCTDATGTRGCGP